MGRRDRDLVGLAMDEELIEALRQNARLGAAVPDLINLIRERAGTEPATPVLAAGTEEALEWRGSVQGAAIESPGRVEVKTQSRIS